MDGASRRRVASRRGGPLGGLPCRLLGSNPRGLSPAGLQVAGGVLRLIALGSDAWRGGTLRPSRPERSCVHLHPFRGGRWQNVGVCATVQTLRMTCETHLHRQGLGRMSPKTIPGGSLVSREALQAWIDSQGNADYVGGADPGAAEGAAATR